MLRRVAAGATAFAVAAAVLAPVQAGAQDDDIEVEAPVVDRGYAPIDDIDLLEGSVVDRGYAPLDIPDEFAGPDVDRGYGPVEFPDTIDDLGGFEIPTPEPRPDQDPVSLFPGRWTGTFTVEGYFWSRSEVGAGPSTRLIGVDGADGAITMTVTPTGAVTAGELQVSIAWSQTTSSTEPVTFDVVTNGSSTTESGTLAVEGSTSGFEASGTVAVDRTIFDSGGSVVDGVGGASTEGVQLSFEAFTADCGEMTGELVAGTGRSILATAAGESSSGGDIIVDQSLVGRFRLVPQATPTEVIDAFLELEELAGELLASEGPPEPASVVALVEIAEAIGAELAKLEGCGEPLTGFGTLQKGWLSEVVTQLLARALQTPDLYDVDDLVTLLGAGFRASALDTALYLGFGQALFLKLDEAFLNNDVDSLTQIVVAGTQFGFPTLADQAQAAIDTIEGSG